MITQRKLNEEILILNPGKVLDNNNAHEMADAIAAAQTENYKFILLDMAQLEFLSSAGVGSILGAVETSREKGGDIILSNVPEKILHVLKVLDLLDYLTVQTSEKATSNLF